MKPGDAIIVPENIAQGWTIKDVKKTIQILYQIVVTTGVLIVAFKPDYEYSVNPIF